MAAKGAEGEKIAVKLDFATFAGLVIGIGGIVGGLILEGGSVREIAAPTALLIVLGGTLGAVMVSTPLRVLRGGMRSLASVFFEKSQDPESMIEQLVDYSSKARKSGIPTNSNRPLTIATIAPSFRLSIELASLSLR